MRKQTKVGLLLAVSAAVLVGSASFLLKSALPTDSTYTRAYASLRPGMTHEEVVAAVGLPPGEYGRPGGDWPVRRVKSWGDGDKEIGPQQSFLRWQDERDTLVAVFTADSLTGCCLVTYEEPTRGPVLHRLKDLFGW